MSILTATGLTKKFGKYTAVDNVSLELGEGEILGLLGPNGAGKTTIIQMLLGILTPDAGEISLFGKDFQDNRAEVLEKVNFSSTYTNLPWRLTVIENLTFISYLYDIPERKQKLEQLIETFKLGKLLKKQLESLSSGQLTRVNLAKALINDPKILLLDEPTASLDPDIADYIRKFLLERRKQENMSMIFTSHNMAEIEEVCDRVVFLNKGKILANDTPENLAKTIEKCHVQLYFPDSLTQALSFVQGKQLPFTQEGKFVTVTIRERELASFLQELINNKLVFE